MRVLITVPTFPPFNSGLGNAALRQAQLLSDHGCSVVVATAGECRNSKEVGGVRVEEFQVSGANFLVNPIRGDVQGYLEFLRTEPVDVLLMNAWQTWSTDICLDNLDSLPGKKVLLSHGLSTNIFLAPTPFRSTARYLLWRPYAFRLATILKRLDALIFLAEDGCDSRFDDLRLARSLDVQMYVVPNALPDYAVEKQDQIVPLGERGGFISVGSYDWRKGHDFVLKAYAKSLAKNRIPVRFFGQDFNQTTSELKLLAKKLGIKDQFVEFNEGFSGAALFEHYRHSIAFLSGSHTECQPLVLLDAMAAGTPFVARATGCINILPGGFSADGVAGTAEAINQMLEPETWRTQSLAGVKAAKEDYHPLRVGDRLDFVLKKIMQH